MPTPRMDATAIPRGTIPPVVKRLLFPPICLGCDVLLGPSRNAVVPLCVGCSREHVPLPADRIVVDGIAACFAFEGPLAAALVKLKFEGRLALAGPLGTLLAQSPWFRRSPLTSQAWDALVPVPLHPWRQWVRGYNQSHVLARWARRSASLPTSILRTDVIRRVRATRPQSELPAAARGANVRDAFAVANLGPIRGRRILLLDDVTTTGSTLQACKKALESAGASDVGALALLRALA